MAGHDGCLALAVSGGSDSLALMHLAAAWARQKGAALPVVLTVDHGLSEGSAKMARRVVRWAKAAGLRAHILGWEGRKPKSGIEAAAREARYRLMGGWMARHDIKMLCVGHTEDDQAETFLLRLARGSGLEGLAAMRPLAPWPVPNSAKEKFSDLSVVRPLLGIGRAQLRNHLEAIGQPWADDPMNEDIAFDRVRIRKAAAALAEAGLSAARIAAAAAHLARARAALETVTAAVLARASRPGAEGFLLDPAALAAAPREIGLRGLAALLKIAGGRAYGPRFEALERLFDRLGTGTLGGGATLHGCRIGPARRREQVFGPGTLVLRPESSASGRKA
jgi:tRNA(Ile)-lysidine synthase